MMALLSRPEALNFLQDVLEMTSVQDKLTNNKGALLDEIIDLFQQRIPFQTIPTVARPEEEQHISTFEDSKAQIFSTQGGLCYDHNVFMKNLLEALGFDVYFVACDIHMSGVHDHAAIIVRNLTKQGELHYVDPGTAEPIYRAIPLDFDKESPVYDAGFQPHKFVKDGEVYSWFHKINKSRPISDQDIIVDGFKKFMIFKLEPRVIDYFQEPMLEHFVSQGSSRQARLSFLQDLRAVQFPGRKLVAVYETSLLLEDDNGMVCKSKIRSKEELLNLYAKYFPQLPPDQVRIAVNKKNYEFIN